MRVGDLVTDRHRLKAALTRENHLLDNDVADALLSSRIRMHHLVELFDFDLRAIACNASELERYLIFPPGTDSTAVSSALCRMHRDELSLMLDQIQKSLNTERLLDYVSSAAMEIFGDNSGDNPTAPPPPLRLSSLLGRLDKLARQVEHLSESGDGAAVVPSRRKTAVQHGRPLSKFGHNAINSVLTPLMDARRGDGGSTPEMPWAQSLVHYMVSSPNSPLFFDGAAAPLIVGRAAQVAELMRSNETVRTLLCRYHGELRQVLGNRLDNVQHFLHDICSQQGSRWKRSAHSLERVFVSLERLRTGFPRLQELFACPTCARRAVEELHNEFQRAGVSGAVDRFVIRMTERSALEPLVSDLGHYLGQVGDGLDRAFGEASPT